jgi:cation diffusion facilitator family transporter
MERLQKIQRVLYYTLVLNLIVAAAKMIYGYRTDSTSMLSDGLHSFFDGASNVIGLIGVWVASHPPDESHPYGHRKFEALSTIAIAVLIFIAGLEILKKAYHNLTTPHDIEVTSISFSIMAVTLLINTGVMMYETRKGKELGSDFLLADAMHTKSDIFVSLSVVVSLLAAKAGYPVIDTIVSIVIALFIAKMGYGIIKSATDVLTDAAQISPEEIERVACNIEGIKGCHGIRTRGKEGDVNVDLHIVINPEMKTGDAHKLAHTVEDRIKKEFTSVIDVVVHIEPFQNRP